MTPLVELHAKLMKISDLNEVLSIEVASFASPWTRDMYTKEISNRSSRAFVYRQGNQIVGYMCFWAVLDEAHLMTIAVHPERRREGFGKAILGHLEEVCAKEGLSRILLEVGRRNEIAKSLYRKCGFEVTGFRKGYYAEIQDDALVMEKRLGVANDQAVEETGAKNGERREHY